MKLFQNTNKPRIRKLDGNIVMALPDFSPQRLKVFIGPMRWNRRNGSWRVQPYAFTPFQDRVKAVIVIVRSEKDVQAGPMFQVIGYRKKALEFRALFALDLASSDHLSIGVNNNGEWVCPCGNRADADGFYPCDSKGNDIEPTPEAWTREWYVCATCGRIIDQVTNQIVGFCKENTLSSEEQSQIQHVRNNRLEQENVLCQLVRRSTKEGGDNNTA